ncbi:MAG: hypothetical protein M3P48_03270 [Actinomycetota bacterium]|nr:hypothetical protein [Actinomycetota bacterium]
MSLRQMRDPETKQALDRALVGATADGLATASEAAAEEKPQVSGLSS